MLRSCAQNVAELVAGGEGKANDTLNITSRTRDNRTTGRESEHDDTGARDQDGDRGQMKGPIGVAPSSRGAADLYE